MNSKVIHLACLIVGIVVFGTGCTRTRTVVVRDPTPVVVTQAPPLAPPAEVVAAAPSPNHVWVPGYYEWQGKRYVWRSGHWIKRPSYAATYVQGHWEKQPNGWVWTPGYWRQ